MTVALVALLALMFSQAVSAAPLVVKMKDGTLLSLDIPGDVDDIQSIVLGSDEQELDMPSKSVAIVNGERITRGQFVSGLENAVGQQMLEQMLVELAVRQAASRSGIKVSAEEIDDEIARFKAMAGADWGAFLAQYNMTEEGFRGTLEISMLLSKLANTGEEISEEDARAFFEAYGDQFGEPELVRASHILVETEDEALGILDALAAGADFAELAAEKSIDGASAANGGDLGFFERGDMVSTFEEAAFALQAGQTSGVVETPYGYHVIRVTDRVAAVPAKYEDVRGQVMSTLAQYQAKDPQTLILDILMSSEVLVLDPRYHGIIQ